MSSQIAHTSSGGIGAGTILTVLFVLLKVCGKITWPWIWVLAPTWIPVAIVLAVLLLVLVTAIAVACID